MSDVREAKQKSLKIGGITRPKSHQIEIAHALFGKKIIFLICMLRVEVDLLLANDDLTLHECLQHRHSLRITFALHNSIRTYSGSQLTRPHVIDRVTFTFIAHRSHLSVTPICLRIESHQRTHHTNNAFHARTRDSIV